MKELPVKEKELLLRDLCARLPYGVIIRSFTSDIKLDYDNCSHYLKLDCIKPYIRPMSSMTEEEMIEFEKLGWRVDDLDDNEP